MSDNSNSDPGINDPEITDGASGPFSGMFPFDILSDFDLDKVNWEKEIKYIGALSGSVIGSFVSTQLSWSLGLRLVTVIGGSYSGAVIASIAYQLMHQLAQEEENTAD